MTWIEPALYGVGFLSGFGLTKRRKPAPPPEEVDEATMQRFEGIMEGSIALERDQERPAILH